MGTEGECPLCNGQLSVVKMAHRVICDSKEQHEFLELGEHNNFVKSSIMKAEQERDEYKACKQHWYEKYMKLHDTLVGNCKGEFNES